MTYFRRVQSITTPQLKRIIYCCTQLLIWKSNHVVGVQGVESSVSNKSMAPVFAWTILQFNLQSLCIRTIIYCLHMQDPEVGERLIKESVTILEQYSDSKPQAFITEELVTLQTAVQHIARKNPRPTSPNDNHKDGIDRGTWLKDAVLLHPEIKELKERLLPLNRAVAFSKYYNPGKPQVKERIDRTVTIQLILQHLRAKGMNKSFKILQQEAGIKCTVQH